MGSEELSSEAEPDTGRGTAYLVDQQLIDGISQALEMWHSGNQTGAVDAIRPLADEGRLPAIGVICWFLQQIPEGWRQAIPYVERAATLGYMWPLQNVAGQILQDPTERRRAPALFKQAAASGLNLDPIGNAMTPFQQGDRDTAIKLITEAVGPWPFPSDLAPLVTSAQAAVADIQTLQATVTARHDEVSASIESSAELVREKAEAVQTRADTLEALLDSVSGGEVQQIFEKRATTYGDEESKLWSRGMKTLLAAACIAILPLLILYVRAATGHGGLTGESFVAAHFAPAVALGAVASVFLSRARGRDRTQQQAQDLATALGTMFVYSGHIANVDERQQFVRDMGRTVIEASLNRDGPSGDGGNGPGLLSELLRRG